MLDAFRYKREKFAGMDVDRLRPIKPVIRITSLKSILAIEARKRLDGEPVFPCELRQLLEAVSPPVRVKRLPLSRTSAAQNSSLL